MCSILNVVNDQILLNDEHCIKVDHITLYKSHELHWFYCFTELMVDTCNLFFFFFILLLFSVFINTNSSLHLLLTAELLWISLYSVVLFIGLIYDNLNMLSLTFFFLVFSAIEFGVGLVLLLLQNIFTRTLSLTENDVNSTKFANRLITRIYLNKFWWK